MSRALNIDAPLQDVRSTCEKHSAGISSIETLPAGATRVVLLSGDSAAIIARAFGGKVIKTPQARTPLALATRGVPLTQDQAAPRVTLRPK